MSAGPGWYPDPAGRAGSFRYWDGQAWSAATHPTPYAPPPPSSPAVPLPSRGRRPPWGWLIGGLALLTALVVVGVLVVRGVGGDVRVGGGPTEQPSPADACPEAAVPSATPPPETIQRVRSGKLSYARVGPPFGAPQWDRRVPFGRDVRSQTATVERDQAGNQTWVAGVLIARLLAGDGFYGPEQGARLVATCITGKFYGEAAVERDDRVDEATVVDGQPAWVIESHLSFRLPAVNTTGELMILVVVDTDDGEAGLFYASIPDTSPQFLEPARAAQRSLQVDG